MPNVRDFLMRNRSWIGAGFLSSFFYLQVNPPTSQKWWGIAMGVFGAWLHGAGFSKSDQFYKDRQGQ